MPTIGPGDFPSGFTVPAGEVWEVVGTVTTPANVLVYGTLQMRSGDTLRFRDIDEALFSVGGGNFSSAVPPPASDVGLYVLDDGVLDCQGTLKVGWNRTGTDPSWLGPDELFITPVAFGSYTCSVYTHGVTSLTPAYPAVPGPEVFNLTRDCNIEGTAGKRAHVYILSSQPQTLEYVGFRYLGPRTATGVILGRWPVHFHHGGEGSRGSVVTGCVVRDAGSYAFVAHDSHGVTFTDCIAFRVNGAGFWWDREETTEDAAYINCLAAEITAAGSSTGEPEDNNPCGFLLHNLAPGGIVRGCVTAAIRDPGSNARGFFWQTGSTQDHWIFEDCVSHNTALGMEWWANQISSGDPPARTDRFIVYNSQDTGIFQGAYGNAVRHDYCILRGNLLRFHNASDVAQPSGQVSGATGADVDVAGLRDRALFLDGSQVPADVPHTFIECKFDGSTAEAVWVQPTPSVITRKWDFICCTVDGLDLEFADFKRSNPGAIIQTYVVRVQRCDGSAYSFTATTGPDVIPAFAPITAPPTIPSGFEIPYPLGQGGGYTPLTW